MKRICLLLLVNLVACSVIHARNTDGIGQEDGVDLCEIVEIASLSGGGNFKCLAFVPAELADSDSSRAALLALPDRADVVDELAARWGAGDVPEENGMIVIVPDIPPELCCESAFARLSEVMQAVDDRYRIDPERLYIWGLGPAASKAFFAARALPDKFTALLGLDAAVFENGGFLRFAALPPSARIEAVKSDPSTYRRNVERISWPLGPELPKGILDMQPSDWGALSLDIDAGSRLHSKAADEIEFTTDRLRFSRCGAYQILAFENYNLPATISGRRADIDDDASVLICASANVSTLGVDLPKGISGLVIDGMRIDAEEGSALVAQKRGGRWQRIEPPAVVVTRKNPDCGGPLSDSLLTPCIFVYGTKSDKSNLLRAWARLSAEEMGRADMRIMSDSEVLADADIKEQHTLVCFGGRDDNLVAAELPKRGLPGKEYLEDEPGGIVHTFLQPSPFAIDRYIVVNESSSDIVSEVRLDWASDWAVYRPGDQTPLAVGSFDQEWDPEQYPEDPWREFARGMGDETLGGEGGMVNGK